jgi:Secretion system C-terminal sorting domain
MEEGFSNTGENSQQLNVSDLASGIYYVELTSAGQTEKIKLMVE